MLGSRRTEFGCADATREELFDVKLFGRIWWGWNRKDESGGMRACSQALFPDYVACLVDARRRD